MKFNNSLLLDTEYSKIVKDAINEVLILHVKETNAYNSDNNHKTNKNDNDNKESNSKSMNLETTPMIIRGETIYYSEYRKKSRTKKKYNLKKYIINIEAKLQIG